jgi:hypothetical protein
MPVRVITTQAELEALVVRGRPETAVLEFKATVDGWNAKKGTPDAVRQDAQRELCRDLSQMANSAGGHVVYGVEEDKATDGVKVAGAWAPLSDPEAMKAWIEDVLPNYCVPSTFTKEAHLVDIPGGRALVVTVQPSRSAVYLWDRDKRTIQCVVRTSTGKKYLNPNELERHLMDGTRAAKLAFDDVWANPNRRDDVVVADGLWSNLLGGPSARFAPNRCVLGIEATTPSSSTSPSISRSAYLSFRIRLSSMCGSTGRAA